MDRPLPQRDSRRPGDTWKTRIQCIAVVLIFATAGGVMLAVSSDPFDGSWFRSGCDSLANTLPDHDMGVISAVSAGGGVGGPHTTRGMQGELVVQEGWANDTLVSKHCGTRQTQLHAYGSNNLRVTREVNFHCLCYHMGLSTTLDLEQQFFRKMSLKPARPTISRAGAIYLWYVARSVKRPLHKMQEENGRAKGIYEFTAVILFTHLRPRQPGSAINVVLSIEPCQARVPRYQPTAFVRFSGTGRNALAHSTAVPDKGYQTQQNRV